MNLNRLKQLLVNKKERQYCLNCHGLINRNNDRIALEQMFEYKMGYKLDLNNPKTFNEKLQWLKLYDRNPAYTSMVDKFEAKNIVADILGKEYIIPTLGIWDRFEDIDFDKLPNSFVLKCTHDSGGAIVCKDKNEFDYNKAKKFFRKRLGRNYFWPGREWPYKNVKPRILCEKYLEDSRTQCLNDYKFFCFNGTVDSVMVCIDRASKNTKYYFFDRNWKLLRLNKLGLSMPEDFTLEKPNNFEKMCNIAKVLSTGKRFIRIDLYSCNNSIYFGEFTFYPQSGFDSNLLKEAEEYYGSKIIK